jgi:selenocysteine lyase/cysteine desulfurase
LAIVEFLASLGGAEKGQEEEAGTRRGRLAATYRRLEGEGERLVGRLWNGLAAIRGVTLYGPRPGRPRTSTVAFTVDGRNSDDVARALAAEAVFVSSGDFYAATVVERLGLARQGLVRAGCACYTTEEEVDRLVTGVAGLIARG